MALTLEVREGEGGRLQAVGGQAQARLAQSGRPVRGQERPVQGAGHTTEVETVAVKEGVLVTDEGTHTSP